MLARHAFWRVIPPQIGLRGRLLAGHSGILLAGIYKQVFRY